MAHWVRFAGAGGAGFGTLMPGSDPVEGAGAVAATVEIVIDAVGTLRNTFAG